MTKMSLLGKLLHLKSLFSVPNLRFTALTQFLSIYQQRKLTIETHKPPLRTSLFPERGCNLNASLLHTSYEKIPLYACLQHTVLAHTCAPILLSSNYHNNKQRTQN